MNPEEGEDDPIYLNYLNDEKGKPLVSDENDPESLEGLPPTGNSFYIQEYPRDGKKDHLTVLILKFLM
jgi:hypothetical protein